MAKAIDLEDIKEYIETHQKEYQQYLKEENQKEEKTKKYGKFEVTDTAEKNLNTRKKYNTDFFIELEKYSE